MTDIKKAALKTRGSSNNKILAVVYSFFFLLFAAAATAIITNRVPVTSVDVEVRSYREMREIQLFFDIGGDINEADSEKYLASNSIEVNRKVSFRIPFFKTIRKLRLDPWPATGTGAIRSISLKFLFLTLYAWDSHGIARDFIPNEAISRFTDRDGVVYIESSSPDPSMACSDMDKIYKSIPLACILTAKSTLILLLLIACMGAGMFVRGIIMDPGAKNVINSSMTALFILAISLPLSNMAFHAARELPSAEYRELAIQPDFEILNIRYFFKEYENYFGDHLGFKNHLLRSNSLYRYFAIGASPYPYIVVGKKGWTFFRSEKFNNKTNSLNDWMGLIPFSRDELEKIRHNLESQKNFLREKGIPYLVMIAPNKETIYPEYLPDYIKKVRPQTRLDQIIEYMQDNSDVEIIDVRNELVRAKGKFDVYYRYDTHWNGHGANVGYLKLKRQMAHLFPYIRLESDEKYYVVSKNSDYFIPDLARMMHLLEYLNENVVIVWHQNMAEQKATRKIKNAVLFSDSFGVHLSSFLKNDIEVLHQADVMDGFDRSLIEREHPSLVILEVVERGQGHVFLNGDKQNTL